MAGIASNTPTLGRLLCFHWRPHLYIIRSVCIHVRLLRLDLVWPVGESICGKRRRQFVINILGCHVVREADKRQGQLWRRKFKRHQVREHTFLRTLVLNISQGFQPTPKVPQTTDVRRLAHCGFVRLSHIVLRVLQRRKFNCVCSLVSGKRKVRIICGLLSVPLHLMLMAETPVRVRVVQLSGLHIMRV